MRTKEHKNTVLVTVVDVIEFSAREADFLRQMATHCMVTNMRGASACQKLVEILDAARIPVRPEEPTYGIFELPGSTPDWIVE